MTLKQRMNRYANASLKITVTISVAAGVGLMNLLPLMNRVFFKNDVLTATLVIYMLTVICVSLIMVNIALLEVRRQSRLILITFAAGALLKLVRTNFNNAPAAKVIKIKRD